MFKSHSADAYFATYVWRFELEDAEAKAMNTAMIAELEKLTKTTPDLSEGEKWQTDQDLHLKDEFSDLVKYINYGTELVLDFLSVIYNSYSITGCWANISAVNTRHMAHTHPNNFLSGVYYVETGPGSDTITIDDPRPQCLVIRPEVKQSNVENAHQMRLKVGPGIMVFFPSWLPHSVDYNRSSGRRISISFNVMFNEFSDTMSKPQWQGNIETTARKGI